MSSGPARAPRAGEAGKASPRPPGWQAPQAPEPARATVAAFYDVKPYARTWGRRAQLPAGGVPFWLHSDCEGEWSADECAAVGALLGVFAGERPGYYGDLANTISLACFAINHAGGYMNFI